MDPNTAFAQRTSSLYTKSLADLAALSSGGHWQELIKLSKDVIQTQAVKDAAVDYAVRCLKAIADAQHQIVVKSKRSSTECSNRLLAIMVNKSLQNLAARDEVMLYLGNTAIAICAMDDECHYNLINIANNTDIRSVINLKALAEYYRLMFDAEGKLNDSSKKEIEHAVRSLNVRYVNMLLMTYTLDESESEQIYLLLNYIHSKRS